METQLLAERQPGAQADKTFQTQASSIFYVLKQTGEASLKAETILVSPSVQVGETSLQTTDHMWTFVLLTLSKLCTAGIVSL